MRFVKCVVPNVRKIKPYFCLVFNVQNKLLKYATQQHQLKNIEFAQLMGMSDILSGKVSKKHSVYKYIPYGNFNDTLPYLIRRLYENYPIIMNIIK